MSSLSEQLTPEVLARLGSLSMMANHAVSGVSAGVHKSISKGDGSDFLQYRPYVPGDDLRYTDWKLYARQDKLYQKECHEEAVMRCSILLDASASMAYCGAGALLSKYQYGVLLAACHAEIAAEQGDSVGIVPVSSRNSRLLPYSGMESLAHLTCELESITPGGTAAVDLSLQSAELFLGASRGMVIIISDFLGWQLPLLLKQMAASQRSVRLCHIISPDEMTLPFHGTQNFCDAESGESIMTSPDESRERYCQRLHSWLKSVRETALDYQACYQFAETSSSLLDFFAEFL